MISIIPLDVLVRTKQKGLDIDSLEPIDKKKIEPVFEASNNPMVFLGAVRIDVQLEEEPPRGSAAFHMAKGEEDEILLGTNALPSLGVQLSLVKDSQKRSAEPVGRDGVTMKQKTYIVPPHMSVLVPVRCDAVEGNSERILWPSRESIPTRVFKIHNCGTVLPVTNTTDEPSVSHTFSYLRKEKVWDTEALKK